MFPTGRYDFPTHAPGTLVWFVYRQIVDGIIGKERCHIALVVKKPSKEECATYGFAGNDKTAYLILTGEKLQVTSSAWLYPLSTFPLDDEE